MFLLVVVVYHPLHCRKKILPVTTKDGLRQFAHLQKSRVKMVHHEQRP